MLELEGGAAEPPAHLALARKWRPKRFADVVGQQHVVGALTGALASGRVHHAFMFTGIRGVGKTTLARILAKALNCEQLAAGEPCGQCSHCTQIDAGVHPDVIEMDAASTTQVDSMRELLETANYAPALGRCKVYIIDEVHMLTRHSFNAMLKTLEEPPAHVKFILATTDPQQVLATVQSRCLRFSLQRLPAALVAAQLGRVLDAEGAAYEPGALEVIAAQTDGSMRDALSVLEEACAGGGRLTEQHVRELVGLVGTEHLPQLLAAVVAADAPAALAVVAQLDAAGMPLAQACNGIVELVHRAQLAAYADIADEQVPAALVECARAEPLRIQVIYEIAVKEAQRVAQAPEPKTAFDMAVLRMMALFTDAGGKAADKPGAAPAPAAPRQAEPAAQAAPPPPAAPRQAKPAAQAAAPPPETQPAPESDSVPRTESQWHALVARLSPPAATLGSKCVLAASAGDKLVLEVEPSKGVMLQEGNLRKELARLCGRQVEVEFVEVGQQHRPTPAQRQGERQTAARQAQREQVEQSEQLAQIKAVFPQSEVVEPRD